MRNSIFVLFIGLMLTSCTVFEDTERKKLEEHEALMKDFDSIDTPTVDKELFRSAEKALNEGDYFTADQFFQQLMKNNSKNPKYAIAYAELMRKMGRCDGAMEVYRNLEQTDAKVDNLDIKEERALCYLNMGDFQKAGVEFTDIINKDSTRWRSINGAGLIFANKQKFNEANQYLDLAADVSNGNPAVLNNQGLVKAILGNYTDAIDILKTASGRAAAKSEQKRRVALNLAMVYAISGKIDAAEAVAKPHLTETQLYNNMGVYAELAKEPELSRTYLNKALSGAPIHYEKAWDNLERMEKK